MKTVLITGASGGIGKEFAKLFAENNYNIVLVARSEDKLNSFAKELETSFNIKTNVIPSDLSKPESSQTLYDEVKSKNIVIDIWK